MGGDKPTVTYSSLESDSTWTCTGDSIVLKYDSTKELKINFMRSLDSSDNVTKWAEGQYDYWTFEANLDGEKYTMGKRAQIDVPQYLIKSGTLGQIWSLTCEGTYLFKD